MKTSKISVRLQLSLVNQQILYRYGHHQILQSKEINFRSAFRPENSTFYNYLHSSGLSTVCLYATKRILIFIANQPLQNFSKAQNFSQKCSQSHSFMTGKLPKIS